MAQWWRISGLLLISRASILEELILYPDKAISVFIYLWRLDSEIRGLSGVDNMLL